MPVSGLPCSPLAASCSRHSHRLCLVTVARNLTVMPMLTCGSRFSHANAAPTRGQSDRLVALLDIAGIASERANELGHAFDQPLSSLEHAERVDRALRGNCLHQRAIRSD